MNETDIITGNTPEFLAFMKGKFPLIHMSNLFFRDIHYGTLDFLKVRGKKLRYLQGEKIAREVALDLEKKGILKRLDHQSFLLNYPEFALPRIEKKAP